MSGGLEQWFGVTRRALGWNLVGMESRRAIQQDLGSAQVTALCGKMGTVSCLGVSIDDPGWLLGHLPAAPWAEMELGAAGGAGLRPAQVNSGVGVEDTPRHKSGLYLGSAPPNP